MMRRPDINDYPPWLRSYIQQPMSRSTNPDENCMNELLQIYSVKRTDSFAKVLFSFSVELIRLQFEVWRLQAAVEKRHIILDKVSFSEKEIAALKACAAQKMSEPTPEQEASWDEALDDQF